MGPVLFYKYFVLYFVLYFCFVRATLYGAIASCPIVAQASVNFETLRLKF